MEDNIKKAIRREEMSRPPMPKDLNARLMQRVEKEVNGKPQTKRKRIIWPWVAAACVAALIIVAPHPPKGESQIVQVSTDSIQEDLGAPEIQKQQTFIANVEHKASAKQERKVLTTKCNESLLAKKVCAEAENTEGTMAEVTSAKAEITPAAVEKDLAAVDKPAVKPGPKPRVLSERDIPITRPENLKYTKEELALMKKQANEAYLKWVELELEIARYNLEQTAAK